MVLITAQMGVARPDWGQRKVRNITPGTRSHLGKLGWRHVLPRCWFMQRTSVIKFLPGNTDFNLETTNTLTYNIDRSRTTLDSRFSNVARVWIENMDSLISQRCHILLFEKFESVDVLGQGNPDSENIYPILGKSHNPGHPKPGLQKNTLF